MKGIPQKLEKWRIVNKKLAMKKSPFSKRFPIFHSPFSIPHSPFKSFFLLLPFYFLLLGASDLNEQLNIRINNGTQGELRDRADMLVRFGGQSQLQGNLDKAIPYWMQAAQIYHQIGDFQSVGRVYDFIGLAYAALGDYQNAEEALRRRLGVARDNKDLPGQVYGLNNIGTVLLRRGSIPGARTTFEEALAIARSINNVEGIGLSLSNLGLAAFGSRDYNQAIRLYEEALIYRNRAGEPIGKANTLNNLGDAYRARTPHPVPRSQDFRDIIGAYGAAMRVAEAALDRPNQYRAIDALVSLYSSTGQYIRAFELLEDRLALDRSTENRRQEITTLQSLAKLYLLVGKYGEARKSYRDAIAVARVLQDARTEAILLGEVLEILPEP